MSKDPKTRIRVPRESLSINQISAMLSSDDPQLVEQVL